MTTNYNYDRVTGEFASATPARPSPIEEGVYLLPACATRVAPPPEEAGKARVFSGGVWTLVPDHRGETWWINGEAVTVLAVGDPANEGLSADGPPPTLDNEEAVWENDAWVVKPDHRGETWWAARGQPVVIEDLGDPADDGLFVTEPAITFAELVTEKKAAIEAAGATRLAAGFSYDFGGSYGVKTLQLRPGTEDRLNWTTALMGYQAQIGAGNGAVEGAFLRTEDNTTLQLSHDAAALALGMMLEWGKAHFMVVWAKKDLADAAQDAAALDAIDLDTGWPA